MCSIRKIFLKNFTVFTEKHLCWSIFLIVAGLKACNFNKKILQHRCFSVKTAKLLRATILRTSENCCLLKIYCKFNHDLVSHQTCSISGLLSVIFFKTMFLCVFGKLILTHFKSLFHFYAP